MHLILAAFALILETISNNEPSISRTWKLVTAKQLDDAAKPMGTVPGSQKKERLSDSSMKESNIAPDLQNDLSS